MTIHERRAACRAAILAEPHRSDRAIALAVGCSRELVEKTRRAMLAAGQIITQPTLGRDGKVYRVRRVGRDRDFLKIFHQRLKAMLRDLAAPEFAEAWRRSTERQRGGITADAETAVDRLAELDFDGMVDAFRAEKMRRGFDGGCPRATHAANRRRLA